ncbi:hypothetical protein ACLOJK_015110, partial [Asimina triloba]
AYVAPYRGGAAEFSVGICVVGLIRLWVMGPVAGWVQFRCSQPATVAPPAVVPSGGALHLVLFKLENTWIELMNISKIQFLMHKLQCKQSGQQDPVARVFPYAVVNLKQTSYFCL